MMQTLRAGIIGVGGYGGKVLEQVIRNENFQLCVIADRNRELAEELGRFHDCAFYDDYRRAIVEEKLDVLFLMLPTFLCGECLQLAARQGIHVFKEAPLARNVPEAALWIKLMEKAGRLFQIGSSNRFSPGLLEARQLISQNRIGDVFLVHGERFFMFEGEFDWRGDPVSAGGGALLEAGYPLVDQIVWSLGLPEQVYSLQSGFCKKRVLPPYRTEDTATVTMKFPQGASATLVCGWMNGPKRKRMIWYGTEGSLEATVNSLVHYLPDGTVARQWQFDITDDWLIDQQIRQFADSVLDDEIDPVSLAKEHIPNVAVIESAYLSARTHLPEQIKSYGSTFDIE